MSSQSNDLQIAGVQKTVTAAGTREPLALNLSVRAVLIRALSTNTDLVYVGDSTVTAAVSYTLKPGETVSFAVSDEEYKHGASINLNRIWLDVAVAGEGVAYLYVGL